LLLQSGLSESLLGRFEVIRSSHWSYAECQDAFGYSLQDYLIFGGYPGGAALKNEPDRWADYLRNAVIEATLSKDVYGLESIRRPALLRQLFSLGCAYSGQELSYRKILGQLNDSGNTATLAHYLELTAHAGLLTGLQKFAEKLLVTKASSPHFMVHDVSLLTMARGGPSLEVFNDQVSYGRMVESAVGAHLLARSAHELFELYWWRDTGGNESDFVIRKGQMLTAIEVKGGKPRKTQGVRRFIDGRQDAHLIIVGSKQASLEDFLAGRIALFR
jgi:predicted AAA+ superfamily ATPase